MEPIYRALIEAIIHIDSREVPDNVADDDLTVLEYICSELQSMETHDLAGFTAAANQLLSTESNSERKEALNNLVGTLEFS